jgi:hypothetical protein
MSPPWSAVPERKVLHRSEPFTIQGERDEQSSAFSKLIYLWSVLTEYRSIKRMVDPITLTAAALGLLTPYLAKTGEGFATRAGAILADKAAALYQALKDKFKDDPYAEQTLARVEEKPESEERQAALKGVLAEKIEDDPDFAGTVRRLVEEAEAAKPGSVTQNVSGDRNVVAGRDITGSNISTGDRYEASRPDE